MSVSPSRTLSVLDLEPSFKSRSLKCDWLAWKEWAIIKQKEKKSSLSNKCAVSISQSTVVRRQHNSNDWKKAQSTVNPILLNKRQTICIVGNGIHCTAGKWNVLAAVEYENTWEWKCVCSCRFKSHCLCIHKRERFLAAPSSSWRICRLPFFKSR